MITELNILLGALCFVCIRTDYVRRGGFLALAIVCWVAARLLTELSFGRAQYDPSYTYGTLASYAAACSLVACLASLFAACWHRQRGATRDAATADRAATATDEPAPTPSERLRELLEDDQ